MFNSIGLSSTKTPLVLQQFIPFHFHFTWRHAPFQFGVYRGRNRALSPEGLADARRRVDAGDKKAQIARELGISRETLYQYLRTAS